MRSQLGLATETTYGEYQAPDRFLEFLGGETLNRNKRTLMSEGLRAHSTRRARRSNRRVVTGRDGSGRLSIETPFDDVGILFEHIFGAVDTSTPNGATVAREHLFTFGSLWDRSFTLQKGVERDDETVVPFTFLGCKIPSWEFTIGVDEFLQLAIDVDARDVTRSEPLEAASFADGNLAHFMQARLLLDNTEVAQVTRAQISGSNPMANERYYLGSAGLKGQQKTNGHPEITGEFTADFVDEDTLVAAYEDDTSLSVELGFVGGEIEEGHDEELVITLAEIKLDGETPKVQGTELPSLTIPFVGLHDGEADISVLLRNADTSP